MANNQKYLRRAPGNLAPQYPVPGTEQAQSYWFWDISPQVVSSESRTKCGNVMLQQAATEPVEQPDSTTSQFPVLLSEIGSEIEEKTDKVLTVVSNPLVTAGIGIVAGILFKNWLDDK